MQVAAFALFTDNREMIRFCTERYKTVLLPNQMAADGSFPLELEETTRHHVLGRMAGGATVPVIRHITSFQQRIFQNMDATGAFPHQRRGGT